MGIIKRNSDKMNIYLCKQSENLHYHSIRSLVCAANSPNEARRLHPSQLLWLEFVSLYDEQLKTWYINTQNGTRHYDNEEDDIWTNKIDKVSVTLIGTTERYTKPEVICVGD
jgi:hypothetical protein